MKILIVFGTRPEAIKLAPVIHEFKEKQVSLAVCVTGQHRELLYPVIKFFDIDVDYNLDIMRNDQLLFDITIKALSGLNQVIGSFKPDWIIVQGDTTTTFSAALAGFYNKINVAHVEAGLRTFSKHSPYPEEMNRVLTTHIADLHFAPTEKDKENLLKEGILSDKIHIVGNTVIDALFIAIEKLKNSELSKKFQKRFNNIDFKKKVILVTGHRRESFGKPLENICSALKNLALQSGIEIIYPVHLNPNVRNSVYNVLGDIANIHLLEPVEYPLIVWLMQNSYLILTDSGGIQEEASSLGKPVIVLRDFTERTASIDAGVSLLAGTNSDEILEKVSRLLADDNYYQRMSKKTLVYGNGNSRKLIADILMSSEK